MFKKKWYAKFMEQANDGTEGGAGGSGTGSESNEDVGAEDKQADSAGAEDKGSKISDEQAKLLRESMQRKEKIKTLETSLTQANEKLKQFDGIDPTAVRDLLAKHKQDEDKALEAKGDFERLKQRMADEHTSERAKLEGNVAELQTQLQSALKSINDLTIGSEFSNSNFIKEKLLMTPSKAKVVYSSHFDFENGQVVGYDKPKGDANRTPLVDASGNPLAFDQAFQKLIDADPEKDALLRATVKQGAASGTEAQSKQKPGDGDKKALTGIERIQVGMRALDSKDLK